MDVRNCKSCGKLYNYYGGQPFCQSCISKLDETFKLVKEYIYDHPEAEVQEISDEFEVSVSVIHRWIREEKLAFSKNSPVGIPCESCGVLIKTGRFCKRCQNNLAKTFSNAYKIAPSAQKEEKNQRDSAKMRFFR